MVRLLLLLVATLCATVTANGHNGSGRPGTWLKDEPSDGRAEDDVQQEEWAALARENVLRMRSDSIRCATPRPRVIKVQEVHPHAYKRFVPSCVELNRCDRQAGCCDDENNVCSAVQKQKVFMYFYVVALGERDGVASVGVDGHVERLRFSNHTRCACRKRKRPRKPPLIGQSVAGTEKLSALSRACLLLPLAVLFRAFFNLAGL